MCAKTKVTQTKEKESEAEKVEVNEEQLKTKPTNIRLVYMATDTHSESTENTNERTNKTIDRLNEVTMPAYSRDWVEKRVREEREKSYTAQPNKRDMDVYLFGPTTAIASLLQLWFCMRLSNFVLCICLSWCFFLAHVTSRYFLLLSLSFLFILTCCWAAPNRFFSVLFSCCCCFFVVDKPMQIFVQTKRCSMSIVSFINNFIFTFQKCTDSFICTTHN